MEFNGTFLVSVISFVIFVFLMNKVLYSPMRKIVTERREFIDGNLSSADVNNKKVGELSAKRDERLDDAKNDARSKYVDSVNQFKSEKNDIIVKAQGDANDELNKAFNDLNVISNETKEGLKAHMTDLANDIIEKVLGYRSEVQGFDNDKINEILYHQK